MSMRTNPIVEEVRRIRDEHAKRFGYGIHAICEDFRRKEKEWGLKTVSRPPRLLKDERGGE